jgi:hypothetical protein
MNISVFDEFEMLAETVLEREASREEIARFNELIREFPDLFSVYVEQLQMHLTLQFRCGRGNSLESVHCDVRKSERQNVAGRKSWWCSLWKVAAAVAILLAGTAVWQEADAVRREELGVRSGETLASAVPAVMVVSQGNVKGLDLPETLPGELRLESGEVVVRLQTGVELALIGPASVAVQSGLRVAMERGRLLANVPHWATGFTVRTRDLEVCDLGTIFSVALEEDVSDVFVFKGSVQVNEAGYSEFGPEYAGAYVGICNAGEGLRSVAGERPKKIAADWPVAQEMFASVKAGQSLRNPMKTLATATEIADLWAERYVPGSSFVAKRGNGVKFQKTAWVRASVPQQEGNNMNRASAAAALTAAAVMMGAGTTGATSVPIQIETSPGFSRHWHTVFTNEVGLKWDWFASATRAELEINGMNGSFATNFALVTSNYLWRAFAPRAPSTEDVYDLRLTFYNGSQVVGDVLTSRLAVVTGAFGKAMVNPGPSDRKWTMVRENSVIPYDASWVAATVDAADSRLVIAKVGGATQTNAFTDAAGYYGWKLMNSGWGYGTFNLALTFPGMVGEWDATVTRPMDGTLIRMQ